MMDSAPNGSLMNIQEIVLQLRSERALLDQAISALEELASKNPKRCRRPKPRGESMPASKNLPELN